MLKTSHVTAVIGLFLHVFTNDLVHAATILQGSSNGFSLELIPKLFSKKSPMYNASLTPEQRYGQMLQLSRKRSQRLASQSKFQKMNPDAIDPNPKIFPVKDSIFVVEVRIGTPPQEMLLELDSGSALTWTQCDGCTTCFQNSRGVFKFHQSDTFTVADCDDPLCAPRICSPEYFCNYTITYGDSDTSKGVLSKDDFAFPSRASSSDVIVKEVRFGCGLENKVAWGSNTGPDNVISGLFGMGRGPRAFVSQAFEQGQQRFSYCLVNPEGGEGISLLNFGYAADSFPTGTEIFVTPLRKLRFRALYFLNLVGIWMNGVKLDIPPDTLPIKPDLTGGMLIDTGVGPTELPKSVFEIIKAVATNHLGSYGIQPYDASRIRKDYSGLALCYNMIGRREDLRYLLPTLTFEFENNAMFTITPDGLAVVFDGFFCLQIVENTDFKDFPHSILGAFMQTDHYMMHDIEGNTLTFGETIGCPPVV